MPDSDRLHQEIRQHYASTDLETAILSALERAGKDLNKLTPEDLAPVDEFHIRGRQATLELAQAAGVDANKYVLDVGSGLGGASRCLAREFGCRVTGIDLTGEYCRVATTLAQRCGMSHLVDYRQGNALEIPFPDAMFDVAWTQHAAMNIPDKAKLYREMHRVLKPGGAIAVYDVLAGPTDPVIFPVPWAHTPEASFLASPGELRRLLEATAFRITSWEDRTPAGREWFANLISKTQRTGAPLLGFHLLLGPDFQTMALNQTRNLTEGRIVLAQVVARK